MKQASEVGARSGESGVSLVDGSQDGSNDRVSLSFPLKAKQYAANPLPTLEEFEQLWRTWDVVTRQMILEKDMLSKPINLRNCCLFYLGHIPTFLDIHLTRATGQAPTEPAYYKDIFERGIDPDVENPEKCHAHSEAPSEWPALEDILIYQSNIRERTRSLYRSEESQIDRKVARALWIGLEHEVMHLETLLYMLLQSDEIRPPPGDTPSFEKLAAEAEKHAVPNEWIYVPATTVKLGLDDADNDEGPNRYFGWDIEKPARYRPVKELEAKARPITVGEYARFLKEAEDVHLPASWIVQTSGVESVIEARSETNARGATSLEVQGLTRSDPFLQNKSIRTVYGPVPLKFALDWPVFSSYNDLASCAAWMGGRIPTEEEVRSVYQHAGSISASDTSSILARKISAVNGHLSNNGIEISPPSISNRNSASNGAGGAVDPHELFVDLDGCNVGFQNWHPTAVTGNGRELSGHGGMGGVWEWTSSVLDRYDGYERMRLYPGYSEDFFDRKHNIVLGGSWATQPRIAGRKTFVNWYQRSYPYAWCGARLVRDVHVPASTV